MENVYSCVICVCVTCNLHKQNRENICIKTLNATHWIKALVSCWEEEKCGETIRLQKYLHNH